MTIIMHIAAVLLPIGTRSRKNSGTPMSAHRRSRLVAVW